MSGLHLEDYVEGGGNECYEGQPLEEIARRGELLLYSLVIVLHDNHCKGKGGHTDQLVTKRRCRDEGLVLMRAEVDENRF